MIYIQLFSLLFSYFLINNWEEKLQITANLIGFESSKGKAMVLLLDQNEKIIATDILTIKNNQAQFIANSLNAGSYAIKVYHDENSNKKLDANILGIPKEKWGVSNNVEAKLGPPDFKKMLFVVKSNISIQIRLK